MCTTILLSLAFTLVAQAKSRVVLVSDVDDTIKLSHVRSTLSSTVNAFWNYKPFLGMAELYNLIYNQPETNIYYVSNAPDLIMDSNHRDFLYEFGFPQRDNLKTRSNIFSKLFKRNTIVKIVQEENPEVLILIGDNGEHDPKVFQSVRDALSLSHPKLKILSYVHVAYSRVEGDDEPLDQLTSNEVPYVTPVEIAYYLQKNGILALQDYRSYYLNMIPLILSDTQHPDRSSSFPDWKDCAGYKWSIEIPPTESNALEQLKDFVGVRCQ